MDRRRCLSVLWGYEVGPNMLCLIKKFWDDAVLMCKANGNFGRPFKAKQGVTHGVPLSPKLFNVLVDTVMRECWKRMD